MKQRRNYLTWIAGALLLTGVICTWAQDDAAPEADPPTAAAVQQQIPAQDTETTFWGLVRQGGWTMVPLGFLSVAAIGLIIYGGVATQPRKMLCPELIPQLQDEINRLHLEQAQSLCTGTPCLLTNTLNAGLERLSDGVLDVDSMEKAMEEASVHEVTAGLKPINYLSIIAQIAPMLGLLGTVSGMIKAFQKIGMGGMGKPELLAANIGEAMVTTATGLIIGIPAMFFYFFLKSRYMSNVSEMSRVLGNLAHHLVCAARGQTPPVPDAAPPQSGE